MQIDLKFWSDIGKMKLILCDSFINSTKQSASVVDLNSRAFTADLTGPNKVLMASTSLKNDLLRNKFLISLFNISGHSFNN